MLAGRLLNLPATVSGGPKSYFNFLPASLSPSLQHRANMDVQNFFRKRVKKREQVDKVEHEQEVVNERAEQEVVNE